MSGNENINWFKDILNAFNENDYKIKKFNECYDKNNNYLDLTYTDNNIIDINNSENIKNILKDIVNDDDVYNKLIENIYDTPHLFLPLFIKKFFKKDSIIIDYDKQKNKYYFNVEYNNELNLNNYYSFLKNKLIKLYKSNYLIINTIEDPNYYNNELNLLSECTHTNMSELFKDFFFIKNNDSKCEIKLNTNFFSIIIDYTINNNIYIKNYDTSNIELYKEKLVDFKKKYSEFNKVIDFNILFNLTGSDKFITYKKNIINKLLFNEPGGNEIKEKLLEHYTKNKEIPILSDNRLLEIYSNCINSIKRNIFIDDNDNGNNCIPSFLFAIFNRKNKYIEKYFLNADVKIKNVREIILAKNIQKELKFIYNILNNYNYATQKGITENYKIDKLIGFFDELLNFINTDIKTQFQDYKTDMKVLIDLLYYLYNIEDINYDNDNNKIKIFDLEKDVYDTNIIIKNAKILLYKNDIRRKSKSSNNYIIYQHYNNNDKIFPPNNIYNLYINSIIFYINYKYYTIYNKNNEYYYKNININNEITIQTDSSKGFYIDINIIKIIKIIEEIEEQYMQIYVYYSYL